MIARVIAAAMAVALVAGCGGTKGTAPKPEAHTASAVASPTPDPAAGLRENVEAYSAGFLTGDGFNIYPLLSERCRERMDRNYFFGVTLAAKAQIGKALPITKYHAEVSGDNARVSYEYADLHDIDQHDEPWVREHGQWHNNDC